MALWIWPAFLFLLLIAVVFPTAGTIGIASGFAVLGVLLTAWTRATLRSLTVRIELPKRLVHDEETHLVVVVSNRSWLPAARIRVRVRVPSGGFSPTESILELAMPRRATHRVEIPVTAHGRGRWRPDRPEILVSDPWGFHALTKLGEPHPPVIVLPAMVPVRRITLPAVSPLAEVPDRHSLLSDPTAIVGVRPYEPGDPLRSIHWPATAAAGTLVRRETERAWARDLLVVLDLSYGGWARGEQRPADAAVTVAASLLVDAILGHRQPAGLITSLASDDSTRRDSTSTSRDNTSTQRNGTSTQRNGEPDDGPTGGAAASPASEARTVPRAASYGIGSSRSHLDAMLVHLAVSRLHAARPLADLVRHQVRLQQPGTTVAVITGEATEDLADALRSLRSTGAAPVLIQVANTYVFDQMVTAPPTGGAPRIEVPTDRALSKLRL